MYRTNANLMQFEQGLNNLNRDEVNSLESELNRLYRECQNPTNALALLRENDIYNTESLEQKLEMVREKKEFLNERFKVIDEVNQLELDSDVNSGKTVMESFGFFLGIVGNITLLDFYLNPASQGIYFLLGAGIVTSISGYFMAGASHYSLKKIGAKLKRLKHSLEYLALQNGGENDKLPSIETRETKQLPPIPSEGMPRE